MSCTSKSNRPTRNWLDLPPDVTANILSRVGIYDILENAQKVCTAWYEICKDPATWTVIHVDYFYLFLKGEGLYKKAVDSSQGQLIDITIQDFCEDEPLQYVADRSSQLRRLTISSSYRFTCLDGTWTEALKKFPLLEELNLYSTKISKEVIETAARSCPKLKTLKLNYGACPFFEETVADRDKIAIAIGENLHKIEHLELIGNSMSNIGLRAILDGCLRLKSLDLRGCLNIDLKGTVGKRCSKQIKCLKHPHESLDDCPYIYTIDRDTYSEFSDDDEYFDHDAEYDNFHENDEYFDHEAEYDKSTEYDEFDRYYNVMLSSMGMLD